MTHVDALWPLVFNFALEYAIRKDWNWVEYISYWYVPIVFIYWAKTSIP